MNDSNSYVVASSFKCLMLRVLQDSAVKVTVQVIFTAEILINKNFTSYDKAQLER